MRDGSSGGRTPRLVRGALALALALLLAHGGRADDGRRLEIAIEAGEQWWVGVVSEAHRMPFDRASAPFAIDLHGNTAGNQAQPLLVSTTGRYVWCDEAFELRVRDGEIRLVSRAAALQWGRQGTTLREAALHAGRAFFPPSGRIPDPLLFTRPQFNTWIELTYDQNQADVLAYARAIVANGFAPGVLMIDEGWAEAYGVWDFHRGRFPEPKEMLDELHALGFEVMLWVCPYIRPDGQQFTALFRDPSRVVWLRSAENPKLPALVQWWDGFSAVTDFTSPQGREWFGAQLQHLVQAYGVDGFKLDGGDAELFAPSAMVTGAVAQDPVATPNRQSELFAQVGLRFPLNEYRATWKMGGQPLAQRLRDKEHTWVDLQKLVPGILNQGLMGYPFSCPDMIGGGEYSSFHDLAEVDQELVVRAAQVHALMPMMQFSVAPWRVLAPEKLEICRRMASLHAERGPEILSLARESARTGEPIVRALEYAYPGRGYAAIADEFLLGPDTLVAPVVEKGARKRRVVFPPGRWKGDDGSLVQGPATLEVAVPLERLAWYRRAEPSSPIRVESLARETKDGPLRAWLARVDLRDPRVSFVVTSPAERRKGDPPGMEARLEPTDAWAAREDVDLAVNGGFFARLDAARETPGGWTEGLPVDIVGLSRSNRRTVSPPRVASEPEPALLVDETKDGRACPCTVRATLAQASDLDGVEEAVGGMGPRNGQPGTLLVAEGENRGATAQVAAAQRHPRTAAGVTRDGRALLLLVVDGRRPGWSIGATLPELASLLIESGAWNAVNLDGGGSSALWLREPGSAGAVVNKPSDGRVRPAANHLGVRVRAR